MSKPKASPLQGQSQKISQQEQQTGLQNQQTAQSGLSQFEGPVQQSPFYKALLSTGTQSTSDAYQNAMANTRARANASGFGEQQPVTQGAETQVEAAEAKDLAAVPMKATEAAVQPELQALGETATIGGQQQQVGEQYLQGVTTPLTEQYQQQQAQWGQGLFDTLLKTGMDAFTMNPYGIFGQQ